MQVVNSQVNSVTVFPNIATVTRVASAALETGENTLVFDQLPPTIVEKSVQLKGFGNATLGTVKIEKVPYVDEPNVSKGEWLTKIQSAEDEIRTTDDKILRLTKEKALLDGIAQKVTSPTEASDPANLEPERWTKMISFYNEKLEAIDKHLRTAEKEKRKQTNQLEKLKLEFDKPAAQAKKMKLRISCIVHTAQAGEILLELSYNVPGAQWYPLYDIRVTSDKKLNIVYQAIVYQTTGEDWENTALKISTARPRTHGTAPELLPWRIEVAGTGQDYEAPMPARMVNKSMGSGAAASGPPVPEAMKKPAVAVETGATAVAFVIAGAHTVKCDGTDQKLTILTENFNSQFNYTTIPVLQPFAYLKAKVTNHTEFPLLPGDANVFLDGNFVTVSRLKTVSPTEEFTISLGTDESFRITRERVRTFEKEGGNLFSKKTMVMLHEYRIKINNFKKTSESITLWDQIPLSPNDQIKVHLVEPVIRENTHALRKNDLGYIEWLLTLKPGEEISIPLKFSIEFPAELKESIII